MNLLLKILFIFLSFFIFHGTNIETVPEMANAPINYIQHDYQRVVFTAQNLTQEIVIQSQNNDSQTYTFDENSYSATNQNKLLLKSNNPLLARGNIHNLSTNIKSEISIRAP